MRQVTAGDETTKTRSKIEEKIVYRRLGNGDLICRLDLNFLSVKFIGSTLKINIDFFLS